MGPLSITCGTTKSCPYETTEFCTCQNFGSKIDQGLKVSYRFTHKFVQSHLLSIEHRQRSLSRFSSKRVKSLVRIRSNTYIFCIYAEYQKLFVLKIDSTFLTGTKPQFAKIFRYYIIGTNHPKSRVQVHP